MKLTKFILIGIIFGIVMTKAEIISWYRIQEMFRFESFHMYGIIGSAVLLGLLLVQYLKRYHKKDFYGQSLDFCDKNPSIARYLAGGIIFGLGWSLVGACPGPLFVLLGHGYAAIVVVIIGALLGTFMYGLLRRFLPH